MATNKFHNVSDEALADEYGTYKQRADAIAEHLEELKTELKARYRDEPIIGAAWEVTVSTSKPRETFDTKGLREFFGDEALKDFIKITPGTVSLRVKERKLAHLENIGSE